MAKTPYDDKRYLELRDTLLRTADEIADMQGSDSQTAQDIIQEWDDDYEELDEDEEDEG